MTPADKQEALQALGALQNKLKAPKEARLTAIANQLAAMTEFSRQAAEAAAPGWCAKFERLHAEFCAMLGVVP